MATDLGKVGIVMKGTWSSSATYEVLDAVSYNNGLYIAKQAVPANTAPTNTTYWQLASNYPINYIQVDCTNISTLADLFAAVSANIANEGTGGIGGAQSTSLKTLLTAPANMGNYVNASITNETEFSLKVVAKSSVGTVSKYAYKYIFSNGNTTYYQTAWQFMDAMT